MLKLLLASNNKHKAQELAQLMGPIGVEQADQKLDIEENGSSFQENAYLKAKGYFERFKRPVVSDDSGLVVEALPDQLGIYSARFGGEALGYGEKNQLLLDSLKEVPREKRGAYFICILCLYLNPEEIFFFEGRVEGHIGFEARGEGGFGYDPVFIPDKAPGEASLAMIPEWKQEHSHRAVAAQGAVRFLRERVCQN